MQKTVINSGKVDAQAMKYYLQIENVDVANNLLMLLKENMIKNYEKEVSNLELDESKTNTLPKKQDKLQSKQMFIKQLKIYNNIEENYSVRRVIDFVSGINFIVDKAKDGEKANNTGKTTALKIIDVCLGAQNKQYIYTDSNTDTTVLPVYNAIVDYNITADLLLTDCLNMENSDRQYLLTVELRPNGKRYINNVQFSQQDYRTYLNDAVFHNIENKPSFRQLISKFVRIDLKEDINNSFLKFLGNYTSNNVYRVIYDYLFRFSSSDSDIGLVLEKQSQIKEDENYIRQLKKRHGNIDSIIQEIDTREALLEPKDKRLTFLVSGSDFQEKVKTLNERRLSFREIDGNLDNLSYEVRRIDDYISLLEKNRQVVNHQVLQELYGEAKELLEMNKSFAEMIEFNERLSDNQISFQENRRKSFKEEYDRISSQYEDLKREYKKDLGLVGDIDVTEYDTLSQEVNDIRRQISELQNTKKELLQTENNMLNIKKELEEMHDSTSIGGDVLKERRQQFNRFFMENTEKICGERYSVVFPEEGFPIQISPMKEGLGSGRAKSLVIAFDLSYLEYANQYKIPVPYFIVHDVLESIDERSFAVIVAKINNLVSNGVDVQYIGSILSEKIKHYSFISGDMIRARVSEDDRFLKI